MPKKPKAPPPASLPDRARLERLNAADLARLLGYSRESVRQWTVQGCPRLDTGDYVVAEVVTWLIARAREAEREKRKDGEKPKTELNRKLSVEADLKELQLAQLRGELITIETHDEQVMRIAGGFNAVAKGQLARFNREIVRTATAADAQKLIDRIHQALMEGAQGLADDLDAEAAEHSVEDPAA
jgi:phage terminase Nu1 subunit (DNA packaging protein)